VAPVAPVVGEISIRPFFLRSEAALPQQARPAATAVLQSDAVPATPPGRAAAVVTAVGAAPAPQDGHVEDAVTEDQATPAEPGVRLDSASFPISRATRAAACDACFGAGSEPFATPAGAVPPGTADEAREVVDPAAVAAALAVALGPAVLGGRPAADDSRSRAALAG
jgi:hypothetical protein